MKNRIILIALLLSLLLLTGCTSPARLLQNAVVTLQPGSQGQLPDPIDPAPREDSRPAALYFRMEGEAYLATEYRMIQRTSNFTYETALVQALLAGPSGQSLSPLFRKVHACLRRQSRAGHCLLPFPRNCCTPMLTSPWTGRSMITGPGNPRCAGDCACSPWLQRLLRTVTLTASRSWLNRTQPTAEH